MQGSTTIGGAAAPQPNGTAHHAKKWVGRTANLRKSRGYSDRRLNSGQAPENLTICTSHAFVLNWKIDVQFVLEYLVLAMHLASDFKVVT